MDYLMFNALGECEDSLRDRDFYLVEGATSLAEAQYRLAAFFQSEDVFDMEVDPVEEAAYYLPFVTGVNLADGSEGAEHWMYRMHTVPRSE